MTRVGSVRIRRHSAIAVAALFVALSTLTLTSLSGYLALLALAPLLVALWAWRGGTEADRVGLRLRAAMGQRWVPWPAVAELIADPRGRAFARLTDGSLVALPAVRAADLPALVAASGQPLTTDAPAAGSPR